MQKRLFLLVILLLMPYESLEKDSSSTSSMNPIHYTEDYTLVEEGGIQSTPLEDLEFAKNSSKQQIIDIADFWVNQDIVIPQIGGNWTHFFTCDDGNRLVYDSNQSSQFWCESESKWYIGEQYETAWAAFKHREVITAGFYLAMAFQITNNSSYSKSVKKILLEYSDLYPSLEANNKYNTTTGNIAKLTTQSLDEAVLITELSWSYQLIQNSCNSTEQQHIEQNLLLAGVQVLQLESNLQKSPLSNWYAYHNSALMMVGTTIENQSLIDEALDGPRGFKFQLANGVYEDGLWHEGSISYHNYTLNSMLFVLESGRKIGLDLYNLSVIDPESNTTRTVKEMFLAPLGMVRPDGFIPRLNDDIRGTNMHDMLRIYEHANFIWEDEVFDWALLKALEIGDRKGWPTYLWGNEISPTNSQPQSRYYDESGIGVLRTENSFLLMDYGPHGGWHGHHDKLSFELYSHQKERFIDSGVTVYSLPISSEWFRTTLGHSTLMVGNQNQLEASGTLLHFYPFERGGFMTASVNNISSGVNSTRTFLLLDLDEDGVLLLDLMNASSNNLQNYSSIYHGTNRIKVISNHTSTEVPLPEDTAWSYVQNGREIEMVNESHFQWQLEGNHSVDLFIPKQSNLSTAFIAEAPNNPANGNHDFIVINATQELKNIEFTSLIHSRISDSATIKNYSITRINESHFIELNFDNERNISLEMNISEKYVDVLDIKPILVEIIEPLNETSANNQSEPELENIDFEHDADPKDDGESTILQDSNEFKGSNYNFIMLIVSSVVIFYWVSKRVKLA